MMTELTGMDISNASMYDGTTATAEAMLLAYNAAKKADTVLVSETVDPKTLAVVNTYAKYHGVNIETIPAAGGTTDFDAMRGRLAQGGVAGVIVQQPNFYGIIEDFTGVADAVHASRGLFVINSIAADLALLLGHAHVGLVDVQGLGGLEVLVRPGEDFPVVHHLGAPGDGLGVLDHPAGVQGDVLRAGHVGVHHGLHLAAIPQGVVTLQEQLPEAMLQLFQGVAGLVPLVEFTGEVELVGAGCPLPVVPAAVYMVEAVVVVGVGEVVQSLVFAENPFLGGAVEKHSQVNVSGVGLELRVEFQ